MTCDLFNLTSISAHNLSDNSNENKRWAKRERQIDVLESIESQVTHNEREREVGMMKKHSITTTEVKRT